MDKRIRIVEVGPRDGFQNVQTFIDTDDKLLIAKALIDSGVKHMEATSFISPKWIPQMADAADVVKEVCAYARGRDVEIIALTPNLQGVKRAVETGIDAIVYVISASETHNMKNVNRKKEESVVDFREACRIKGDKKMKISIATAFGCPYEKEVGKEKVLNLALQALEAGADEIIICDTIGVANPYQVRDMIRFLKKEIDLTKYGLGLHLHDTRGMSLACTVMAIEEGVRTFESAVGGLGGCPFAAGATGNQATEDLVAMLAQMGFETGIDLDKLLQVTALVEQKVDFPITSHMYVMKACSTMVP